MKRNLLFVLFLFSCPGHTHALQPLPLAGTDIPVNVLMCKTAAEIKNLVEKAHSMESDEYKAYLAAKEKEGVCEVGGGAKILEVAEEPFFKTEQRQIHLLKVRFGGKDYYSNFNRQH